MQGQSFLFSLEVTLPPLPVHTEPPSWPFPRAEHSAAPPAELQASLHSVGWVWHHCNSSASHRPLHWAFLSSPLLQAEKHVTCPDCTSHCSERVCWLMQSIQLCQCCSKGSSGVCNHSKSRNATFQQVQDSPGPSLNLGTSPQALQSRSVSDSIPSLQSCPLDGKHPVLLAACSGHLLRSTGTTINVLELQPCAASADGITTSGISLGKLCAVIMPSNDLQVGLERDSPHALLPQFCSVTPCNATPIHFVRERWRPVFVMQ